MLIVFLFVPTTNYGQEVRVCVLDVGQGDSLLIFTPQKQTILIDGGPNGQVLDQLSEVLPFWQRRIDILMLTHPDSDHVAGLVDVLQRFQVGQVFANQSNVESVAYQSFMDALDSKDITPKAFNSTTNLSFKSGMTFEGKWPNKKGDFNNFKSNSSSQVGVLRFGQFEMMLTGDIDTEIADLILQQSGLAKVDVLKVPHHGSKYGLKDRHLSQVEAEVGVISVGADNRYGHPSAVTLDALTDAKLDIYRTDQHGRIEIIANSAGFSVRASKSMYNN